LLIVAGSFCDQGEMNLWWVIGLASGEAIAGDQIGYGLGRWGGTKLALRVAGKFSSGEDKLRKAEAFCRKWGGAGVFFSRWLITPLGPWINITSGITGYSWYRFLFWDALGEVLWVVLYVGLGKIFSDRVQALNEALGNLTWVILGLLAAAILGWKLLKYLRAGEPVKADQTAIATDPASLMR
jgi:membrane protein DedA with SNARE-associated domain